MMLRCTSARAAVDRRGAREQVLAAPRLTGRAVVHLDHPGEEPANRVVGRLLGGRDEHLVDGRLRADRAGLREPVLRGARSGAQRVELDVRLADDLRGAVVVRCDVDEPLEPPVEVRDALPEARGALVGEDAHGHGPAAVQLAEHPVGRDHDVVEEHLGELELPVEHLERRDGDPRRVHVDEERGDAPVARIRRARCA